MDFASSSNTADRLPQYNVMATASGEIDVNNKEKVMTRKVVEAAGHDLTIDETSEMSSLNGSTKNENIIVAKTATSFPQMPPELRNMVWQFAANEPRVMQVRYEDGDLRITKQLAPNLPILEVSHEARTYALKVLKTIVTDDNGKGLIYCHPNIDTLWFSTMKDVVGHLATFVNGLAGMEGTPIVGLNLEHLQRLYYHPYHTGAVFKVFKRLQEAKITTLRVVVNSEQFNRPHNLQLSTATKSPRRLYRECAACQSVVDASWERFSTVLTRNFEFLRKFFVAWKHEETMGKFCVHSKSAGHH